MEQIPAPYMIRMSTPWKDYADGTWRLAHQSAGDFRIASTWVRAGRAWAKRHKCESRFFIEGQGSRVRFVITPAAPEPAVLRAPSPEAVRAWKDATALFLGPEE